MPDTPEDLALNPSEGEMFWSENGKRPSIWKAGMDGNEARTIVTEDLGWPKSLAIDYADERLFWIDSKFHSIQSVRFNGEDYHSAIRMEGLQLRSLSIFDRKLYWSDWHTKTIQSVTMGNWHDLKTYIQTSALINDMDIYHSSLKPELPNPCDEAECQELCLLGSNYGYTCACRIGRVLSSDSHSCIPVSEQSDLVIAAGDKILYYRGEMLGKAQIEETLVPVRMSRIVFDRDTGNLIGADQFTDVLYSFDLQNHEIRVMAAPLYSQYLGGIDINHRNKVISWSVTNVHRVDQMNLCDGRRSYYTFEDVPQDILSISTAATSFVVFKSDVMGFRIDWVRFSRQSHHKTIVSDLIGPKISLAFDRLSQRVYFADEGTGNIESFAVNSECLNRRSHSCSDRQVLCSGVKNPVSLAICDRKVYWTLRDSNILQWVEIDDEYRVIKSKELPIENSFGIMDIAAVDKHIVSNSEQRCKNSHY